MPKKKKHGRMAIRRAIRKDYDRLEKDGGYRAVGEEWGLSSGTAYRLVAKKRYWPSDEKVKDQIQAAGLKRGIVVGVKPLPKE